jgi:hypothetical protein
MNIPRHGVLPMFNLTGYHLTRQADSVGSWDLRVDASNGDALTVDGISVTEGQAFIKCLQNAVLHTAPTLEVNLTTPDEIRIEEGLAPPRRRGTPPQDPPADPSGVPAEPTPKSPAPEQGATTQPYATGGPVQLGQCVSVVGRGEYVASPSWTGTGVFTRRFELDVSSIAPAAAPVARFVHVPPGTPIEFAVWCSCGTMSGGLRVDNPSCEMHHGQPTVYVFDGS